MKIEIRFCLMLIIAASISGILLPFPFCEMPSAAQESTTVRIDRDADFRTTIYRISGQGGVVEWIVRDSEAGVVKHYATCAGSMAAQVSLIRRIFDIFLRNDPAAGEFHTLFWGRLVPETPDGSWEMGLRLALAAHLAPEWDSRRGNSKKGNINRLVKELANRALIYPELKALFTEFDRDIQICSVEKVLVSQAADLPFYNALKVHGVQPEDKLPFDCLTWFCLSTQ